MSKRRRKRSSLLSVTFFPATASLGVVSDDDCHIAVYDIYGTETATCNTGYPRTGKQILEFTELIGTLYYQKKDHADLVHKSLSTLRKN